MLTKHLAKNDGKNKKNGRSSRVLMTNEARVLRELRIQAGLSMRKAGELIGVSDSYISHIENGRSDTPTGIKLDKFLLIYGGMKQKSFHERSRNYTFKNDPYLELVDLIRSIPKEKINFVSNVIKQLLQG
ncbi:MAG: helix-turn-helix domain-containing protein [Pseudobdellovibrio sp.]